MTDKAEANSQAVMVAQEKLAEILAVGYPKLGTNAGTVEENNRRLDWRTEVTDLQLPRWDAAGIAGLRRVLVEVAWKQSGGQERLEMSTYIADRKLNE